MSIPGFSAELAIYEARHYYRTSGGPALPASSVQPALFPPPGNCWSICGDDIDCMICCECLRHGGHPNRCCF